MTLDELGKLYEAQGSAWEEFKTANDKRLVAIETKGFAPADLVETVEKNQYGFIGKGKNRSKPLKPLPGVVPLVVEAMSRTQ